MNSEFRNWSDVRVFLAVMRHGSTLAASRALGMAQPTVARRIDALEHELGVTLFDRDNRGFRPTAAALSLLPKVETMEAAAIDICDQVRALTKTRPIRITAAPGNFSDNFNAILSEYSAEYPNTEFEFLPTTRAVDLIAGEADIALRLTQTTPDSRLIRRKISTAKFTLFGAPAYRDRHGLPETFADLRLHKFVSFQREDVNARFTEWLLRHVPQEQIVRTYAELDLMHAAMRSGIGLGISNLRLMDPEVSAGRLIPCFSSIPEMDTEFLILISPEAHRRPEVRQFTRFFAPRYAAIFR